MIAEPYKIKEVKKIPRLQPYERWTILKAARFNTLHITADKVTFDMVTRGMSGWSHYQKAALMIGDEAYAGARSFYRLEQSVREVLGIEQIVPAHNRLGAEKLLVVTMLKKGQVVPHNRGRVQWLVPEVGGLPIDVTSKEACDFKGPEAFGGNIDLEKLRDVLKKSAAFVYVELCPSAWNGQPISIKNLEEVRRICLDAKVPLVLDISCLMEAAWWVWRIEKPDEDLTSVVKRIVGLGDIWVMDASQDPRSDIGGFIACRDPKLFDMLRNQVVVYEGLHTYGGMSGRAMETFAVGIEEMIRPEYVEWHQTQISSLHSMLVAQGVPASLGTCGIALDVQKFLPHLQSEDNPKFVLAACLYLQGGVRPRMDGRFEDHIGYDGRMLMLDVPRCAYTINHLHEIADIVSSVYAMRDEIAPLRLANKPEFVDEAEFVPARERLFVFSPHHSEGPSCEPYKIAIFEPVKTTDREFRKRAIRDAGYNTFLLRSEDVYIDFLTDSGTSAMSCHQWEGMTDSSDTPYANRHYEKLVETFREVLGFNYILPTHQGRAAEHIMSQCMIRPGQVVPGNMYFTTTKLHQEMAGGVFVDVIVDEAHDPVSTYPWKGNIDIQKLKDVIERYGPQNVAYISHECCVNMAGGQPFSMDNLRELSRLCQRYGIPIMFDATRCIENAWMIKMKDPAYANRSVREILREMMSYGDGCTISCKKDFLVNMGGILACNGDELYQKFSRMLRLWEGEVSNGGMDTKDMEALTRGFLDSLEDDYIRSRIAQTQRFGNKLRDAGIPIVEPPGSHAIFLDAKRFLPHVDQDEYPAQALAAAVYIETGVRTMERGNVSKGRDPATGQNYRPQLELVRFTIPRRVYTDSHIDYVVEGVKRLFEIRDRISGLRFVYEPPVLRFFQGRFEPIREWDF